MDSFFDENPEIDNSGTNVEPLNLGWIRGKNNANGKKWVHKIGNLYYCGMVKYTSTKDGSKTILVVRHITKVNFSKQFSKKCFEKI